MKGRLTPEDAALWVKVTAEVRLLPGRTRPTPPLEPASRPSPPPAPRPSPAPALEIAASAGPREIEPRRLRRIARRSLPIEARIDLHGLDQDRARTALVSFILRAQARGARAVLVVTGKGRDGQGALRRAAPEWLAQEPVRQAVAGLSPASRHDGGHGAYYVALRHRVRPA